MTNTKVIYNKKHFLFTSVFLYIWFFYIDTGSEHLSPEELESYKEELSDWVRDNEERLRQVTS